MKRISVIIASCNLLTSMQSCIYTLHQVLPQGEYELIVVDNASQDGSVEWLRSQPDIQVITNLKNIGMAAAWNQGIAVAQGKYLLFMHNDVILTLGAYERMEEILLLDPSVGAVGPVFNRCRYRYQNVPDITYRDFEGLQHFARSFEERGLEILPLMSLENVCLLMRRETVQKVGLFDERFQASGYEDVDYSMRLLQQGYYLLCVPVFVHHDPGSYEQNQLDHNERAVVNQKLFHRKWGFGAEYSTIIRRELLQYMDLKRSELAVLDIGCSCGGNLLAIKLQNDTAQLYGIELNEQAAAIAQHFAEITATDVEHFANPDWQGKFDYIIMADILEHLRDPWAALTHVVQLLKPGGRLLVSIPNVMHISNVKKLLNGYWQYEDAGILDRTHLRFFTKKTIEAMLVESGLKIERMEARQVSLTKDQQACLEELTSLPQTKVSREDLLAFQWMVLAERQSE